MFARAVLACELPSSVFLMTCSSSSKFSFAFASHASASLFSLFNSSLEFCNSSLTWFICCSEDSRVCWTTSIAASRARFNSLFFQASTAALCWASSARSLVACDARTFAKFFSQDLRCSINSRLVFSVCSSTFNSIHSTSFSMPVFLTYSSAVVTSQVSDPRFEGFNDVRQPLLSDPSDDPSIFSAPSDAALTTSSRIASTKRTRDVSTHRYSDPLVPATHVTSSLPSEHLSPRSMAIPRGRRTSTAPALFGSDRKRNARDEKVPVACCSTWATGLGNRGSVTQRVNLRKGQKHAEPKGRATERRKSNILSDSPASIRAIS